MTKKYKVHFADTIEEPGSYGATDFPLCDKVPGKQRKNDALLTWEKRRVTCKQCRRALAKKP